MVADPIYLTGSRGFALLHPHTLSNEWDYRQEQAHYYGGKETRDKIWIDHQQYPYD